MSARSQLVLPFAATLLCAVTAAQSRTVCWGYSNFDTGWAAYRDCVALGAGAAHVAVLALVGSRLFQQAFVLDATAPNSMGAVMSDAAAAIVGG